MKMNRMLIFLVVGLVFVVVDHVAVGFSPPQIKKIHRQSSCLQDALFDELFDDETSGNDSDKKLQLDNSPPKDYNDDAPPFSDFENPQDRARRMENARQLQKIFYTKEQPDGSSALQQQQPDTSPTRSSSNPIYGSSVIYNLPTLTTHDGIQNADKTALLPGK